MLSLILYCYASGNDLISFHMETIKKAALTHKSNQLQIKKEQQQSIEKKG